MLPKLTSMTGGKLISSTRYKVLRMEKIQNRGARMTKSSMLGRKRDINTHSSREREGASDGTIGYRSPTLSHL